MPGGEEGVAGGKLKAVARRWAGGRGGSSAPADDALTKSAPLPEWMTVRPSGDQPVEVPPDIGPAVSLFFSLETQWRTGGMAGVRTGLDYAAIAPTALCLGIEHTPDLLADLRVMEREALKTFAETRR